MFRADVRRCFRRRSQKNYATDSANVCGNICEHLREKTSARNISEHLCEKTSARNISKHLRETKILFFLLLLQIPLLARSPYNILDFGAKPDGTTLNTVAIQAAIDRAHFDGKGVVLIPEGIFLSGSIWLKSGVELRLAQGAMLLGSTHRPDYARITWYALILAEGQDHIAITGQGIIDGQGAALAADVVQRVQTGQIIDPYWGNNRPHERERPQLIEFKRCHNVRIEGVTLRNSACWVQTYDRCDQLKISKIRVESMAYWNNDGIDLVDSRNVLIADCFINSADDGICLKSSWPPAFCENIRIERCTIRSSASAFKIGTASRSGFRTIRVRDLTVYDTYRSAVAIEVVDGAFLENVDIDGVRAIHTGNAIFIRLGHRNGKSRPGALRNVRIRNLYAEISAGRPDAGYPFEGPEVTEPHNPFPSSVTGLPEHPVRQVRLENIRIVFEGGSRPGVVEIPIDSLDKVPERPSDYPEFSMFGELPAWGFYLRHAEGVQLKNVRLICQKPAYRPAIVADDTQGLHLEKLRIIQNNNKPLVVLRKAQGVLLEKSGLPDTGIERVAD